MVRESPVPDKRDKDNGEVPGVSTAGRKVAHFFFVSGHALISIFFVVCAFALIGFAVVELWSALFAPQEGSSVRQRFDGVLQAVGLLTISVAALELGQTILEEEVHRQAHMSAPTRVRRFLSRFMVVIVVSLSIETLVAVFQLTHEDPSRLPQASFVGFAAAALLAAWGLFVRMNTTAERLEPEAMEHAKSEDRKLEDQQ